MEHSFELASSNDQHDRADLRSASRSRELAALGLTITIHVIITRVPFAIAVRVPLVKVVHISAVITRVTMAILVTVLLVYVGLQPAVILQG